jgi:hypothetical protein
VAAPAQTAPPSPVTAPSAAPPLSVTPAPAEPPVVTPVTPAPYQWESPPQGKSPFADQEPVKMFEPEAPKPCTKEAFDRGLCVTR